MCGLFGIFAPGKDVSRLTFFGLLSLQHRGQESAGIVSSDFKKILIYKNTGLVNQIFHEKEINKLKGKLAIGHTRYSTAGSSTLENAQPFLLSSHLGKFALAHNGNLANYKLLKKTLLRKGHGFETETDSEVIARIIINSPGRNWRRKIIKGLSQIKGAYSLVILVKDKLYVVRDPWGIRPLVLGKVNTCGWLVASETTAIESINGKVLRAVKPGEFIEISKNGLKTFHRVRNKQQGFCLFEYIYFSRPDSVINNRLVQNVRLKAGKILAREAPAKADFVISVPDSGTSAALGFAQESGLPYQEGLIKSRYVGRTFIQPVQKLRKLGVRLKFSPLKEILKNKRVVLIDDSIVRGTTIAQIVKMLRKAGVKKIHLRIASPPFKNICYLGVDVARYRELIAAKYNVEEIRKKVGADSLAYLSLEGIKKAVGQIKIDLCTGCFNGNYPVGYIDSNKVKQEMAVLISTTGKGTNLRAIIDGIEHKKINGKIVVVVSDTADAFGLKIAKKHHIPIHILSHQENLTKLFKEKYSVKYLVLAGWKKIIPGDLINLFHNRILNLHPGLIPDSFGGKVKTPDGEKGLWNRGLLGNAAIKNFLDKKATYAGSSIHFLTKKFDFGPVLARCFEKILPDDTVNSLYCRLKKKENEMYVSVLQTLCRKNNGKI